MNNYNNINDFYNYNNANMDNFNKPMNPMNPNLEGYVDSGQFKQSNPVGYNDNYKQNTHDTYNYNNNNYNQPMFNQQPSDLNLFDPYNGFIRGNMFPSLFNSYKITQPFEIQPMNEQAELLTNVDKFAFAAHDMNLFLDVYPEDRSMIELFNRFKGDKNKAIMAYEEKFGPLSINSDALGSVPWAWNRQPWPWDAR